MAKNETPEQKAERRARAAARSQKIDALQDHPDTWMIVEQGILATDRALRPWKHSGITFEVRPNPENPTLDDVWAMWPSEPFHYYPYLFRAD